MRRTGFALFASFLCWTVWWAGTARAADGPVDVQIKTIPLAAVSAKGYQGRTNVTPYVTVKNADALQRLCGRLPVFIDVLAQEFEAEPLRLASIEEDLKSRQAKLHEAVEGALGTNLFVALHIVQGGQQPGAMTRVLDLAGGNRDCQPIAYMPWARPAEAVAPVPAPRLQVEGIRSPLPPDDPLAPELQLSDAELERFLDEELKGVFPGAPPKPEPVPYALWALGLFAFTGILLMAGSYIGYKVGKMRRDRRRKDRRKRRKERRSGLERRQLDQGPPPGVPDRRTGTDRRTGDDRRRGDRRLGPRPSETA